MGFLERAGYLSSVSGGGWPATWFMLHDNNRELFEPGSSHLHHLAQYGNFLVAGHSSSATADSCIKASACGISGLLCQSPANIACDYDRNVYGSKDQYRDGLVRAFQYSKPLPAAQESTWPSALQPLSMRSLPPSQRGEALLDHQHHGRPQRRSVPLQEPGG